VTATVVPSAILGTPRVHLRRTASTNDLARALAVDGAPHGTLVTAAEQTAGRGRQGRQWLAPPGSALLMSLLLRPGPAHGASSPEESPWPGLLQLRAAVAVCDVAGPEARVKWPNDVVVERGADPGTPPRLAKLAGILAEGRPQAGWAVLGIGVNVAVNLEELPPELQSRAASLQEPPEAVEPLLGRLLRALEQRLREPPQTMLAAWGARDALRGREIDWTHGHGRAEGVDAKGGLVVLRGDGVRETLNAGEVHLRS
jgi:BirA family biotin operon repressor/biotin-[acetyl-CoA-carboxylase] ligase